MGEAWIMDLRIRSSRCKQLRNKCLHKTKQNTREHELVPSMRCAMYLDSWDIHIDSDLVLVFWPQVVAMTMMMMIKMTMTMMVSHHSYKMNNIFNTSILQGNYRRLNLEVLYSPKSANFNSPLSLMSRFCGLRSLQIKSSILSGLMTRAQ